MRPDQAAANPHDVARRDLLRSFVKLEEMMISLECLVPHHPARAAEAIEAIIACPLPVGSPLLSGALRFLLHHLGEAATVWVEATRHAWFDLCIKDTTGIVCGSPVRRILDRIRGCLDIDPTELPQATDAPGPAELLALVAVAYTGQSPADEIRWLHALWRLAQGNAVAPPSAATPFYPEIEDTRQLLDTLEGLADVVGKFPAFHTDAALACTLLAETLATRHADHARDNPEERFALESALARLRHHATLHRTRRMESCQ